MAGATLTQSLKTVAELAASGDVQDALAWISEEKKWINERHLEVSRIAAPTFQERERAEWMAARFRAMGCQSRLDRAGNMIAYLDGPGAGPLVALTAHLDTVLAPRVPEEIQYGRDGTLYGPGVADNGAGLAALLAVAQALRSAPRRAENSLPLVFIANVGEEGEGNLSGMRYLCRPSGLASRIRAFVVLDGPSTDHITCRALASRRFEVTLAGPGGHSWSDYGVGNPVHALGRAIALFSEQQTVLGNAIPRASFNFGTIEGGTSVNSIPTTARAKLDIRSENPEKIEELAALLTASVERAIETENDRAAAGRVTAKIREIGSRPGGQLAEDAAILTHVKAVDRHLRIRSSVDCASTDANIPLSLGMQAISIGAGGQGGGAHTPGEWYHPEGRELGLQRIVLTLFLLMREIDPEAGR